MRWAVALAVALGCRGPNTDSKPTNESDTDTDADADADTDADSDADTDSGTTETPTGETGLGPPSEITGEWIGDCAPVGGGYYYVKSWSFDLMLDESGGSVSGDGRLTVALQQYGGGHPKESGDTADPWTSTGPYTTYSNVTVKVNGTWDGSDLDLEVGVDTSYGVYRVAAMTGPVSGTTWTADLVYDVDEAYAYSCTLERQ